MSPGPWQIVIIAVVILLLFGASRFADMGKGLGEGIRNFKKGISDGADGDSESKKESASKKDESASKESDDDSKKEDA